MSLRFYPLRVTATQPETAAAKTLVFETPSELRQLFRWRPGQHLTLRFSIDGEELRRSYSISSSPLTGEPLRVTVKRIADGRVSNHIHDAVSAGDLVEVMPPCGSFCLDPSATGYRTYYLFAAGSGITPLYSMLTSVLHAEPQSAVHLLYGNRNAKSIIFRDPLETLASTPQLTVTHLLSSPSMWSSFQARNGRINAKSVTRFIDEHPPYAQDTQYYVCGPGDMNATVTHALMQLDVPRDRIHRESYGGDAARDEPVAASVDAVATVVLGGQAHRISVPRGATVLAALRDAGLEPPYSCQAGVCSACRARLVKGSVHMRARMALEDHEVEAGAILTCQSLPTSEALELHFEG